MNIKEIFYDFLNAVNEHNIGKIYSLMDDEHIFFDAWGGKTIGKDEMKNGWEGYFKMFPDYKIEITDIYFDKNKVAAFGFAGGTYEGKKTEADGNYWRVPAAWQVEIINGKIKLWQVCADQKKVIDILEENKNMNFS
jgi:ketosteroid isomerase-like protein